MITDSALVHFTAARRELALARTMDEVKDIRDKAEMFRAYLKQQGESLEMQNHCAEIKLRAERRAGEFLAEMEKRPGGPKITDNGIVLSSKGRELPPSIRDMGISFNQSSEWQLEASVPEELFEQHIAKVKAAGEELTSAGFYRLAVNRNRERVIENLPEPPPLPQGKYRCLVIDPPWPVQKIAREVRPNQADALDYPTMSLDEIAALPVPTLATDAGCHLYLWVTQKYLPAGLDLVARWGFRYQCLLTWLKPVGMTPYSWMYNTEHVIFATLGNLPLERLGLKLGFTAPVNGHSVKPTEFYERALAASPEPRLEMFARQPHAGFEPWGNEVKA